MNNWAGLPRPITGTCHVQKRLYVRLACAATAVKAATQKIGGEEVSNATEFWRNVHDQRDVFFSGVRPTWRISLQSTAAELELSGPQLVEWSGALRWLKSDDDALSVRKAARKADGHATLFRRGALDIGAFHPLPDASMQMHRRVKQAMDPTGILNPRRMYPEW
jgi:glycolate oxidase FAD binding subunit